MCGSSRKVRKGDTKRPALRLPPAAPVLGKRGSSLRSALASWVQDRVVRRVIGELKRGISANNLARSVAFGVYCGLFPVPGCGILASAAATFLVGLNPVIPQVRF